MLPSDVRNRIESALPQIRKNDLTLQDFDRIVRYLILTEQYDAAEIRRRANGEPYLYVGRIRRVSGIETAGVKQVSENDVRREFGIAPGTAFDQQNLIEGAERVRRFYEGQGFAQARVDLEFQQVREGGTQVSIRVSEGPQTKIKEFEIIANNPILKEKLGRALRGYRGQAVNEKTLNELRSKIREFLSENRFFRSELQDPQIVRSDEPAKSKFIYRFSNSDQYIVQYVGNAVESDRSLTTATNLNQFSSANPNIGLELSNKIKTIYVSKGFARAEVKVEETAPKDKPHTRLLQFFIKEGPRVKLRTIEWVGRFSEPGKYYSEIVINHSSKTVQDGYYVKDDLDLGFKNLIVDRQNQGFLKAKIISTRTAFNSQKNEIAVQVNFDEGPLTQIRSVTFHGAQAVPESELREELELTAGEPLKLNRFEEAIVQLKRFYRSRGFLEMSLQNEKQVLSYSEDNAQVDVRFEIYEGPQVKVGSIIIDGNSITRDYVVLKELEFKVGDTLTPELIEESIARLQRIGHFNSVEIRTLEERTATAVRTVIVRVADRNPGLFLFGIGFSNERRLTVRGYTGIGYRNIAGMGRAVTARLDVNYNVAEVKYPERRVTLGYLEPYLFDLRTRGRINLTQAYSVSPAYIDRGSELRQSTISIEQDITSNILASWDLHNLAKVRDFTIPDETEKSSLTIASTGPTLDLDYRDHPFSPTRGTFSRLNLEYGTPRLGSDATIEYLRAYASFTHYWSIGKTRLVWANSVRTGFLQNLSNQSDGSVPYDKKGFVLGGESTIRGFTPGEAFPNHLDFTSNYDSETKRYSLTTEATMYLIKSELRFPVIWGWMGAIFYDGGAVHVKGVNFERPYRDSVGIAARYPTPVGAINLEYGWKIRPRADRGEGGDAINISIGTY